MTNDINLMQHLASALPNCQISVLMNGEKYAVFGVVNVIKLMSYFWQCLGIHPFPVACNMSTKELANNIVATMNGSQEVNLVSYKRHLALFVSYK